MKCKELDLVFGLVEKRLPDGHALRPEAEKLMGDCVGSLHWDEVHNPEFELSQASVEAFDRLKSLLVDNQIATATELS